MKPRHLPYPLPAAQRGITLIEALIALLILALGVLALAAVQARMLVEVRTTNSRATAIRLIADLGDRIHLNATGAQPPVGGNSPYADPPGTGFQPPNATNPNPDCSATANANNSTPTPCTPLQQAAYDRWDWLTEVGQSLLNGSASITQVSPQQLRVIVAWQLNENTGTVIPAPGAAATGQTTLANPLQITDPSNNGANLCNPSNNINNNNFICHVDFIGIPPL
jgi:type IV pilus assembly protein PilV